MRSGLLEQVKCPKCGGSLFLDRDRYGWYEQCLQCGYEKTLDKAYLLQAKPVEKFNITPEPALPRNRK